VLAAHAAAGRGEPGTVLAAGPSGVEVACGDGVFVLDRVKPAGRGAMDAAAWVAGRGVVKGDRFDTTLA
jgi:methionyl-tRNA formyltransferase